MSSQDKILKLSKYLVLSSIGSGGFSKVYLIKDKETGIKYAAKVSLFLVDEETQDQNETLAQFREINLLSIIDHPAILKFIGFSQTNFEGDPTPTIVTEYASNGSLYDILEMEKSGLSFNGWDDTKKLIIIYGIASGMSYLHSHQIIHRDMKPQNILIDEFLHPKISDFGLSKINESLSTSMNMQSQKGMKGTLIYMAPEIFTNDEYSEASDVYAFSIIIYEVFSLETPFIKLNFTKIVKKVSNGERPKINDFVPDAFKNLIQRCWSQEPDKRPSFSEIVEELKTDNSYITDLMDEMEFLDYVDFIDNCKSSFDKSKQLLHFDEFVKVYGRNKEFKKVVIDKENIKKKPITITKDMLIFELDEDNNTAYVIGNDEASGDVLIPRSIILKEQEFIVTCIMKEAFSKRKQIRSIQFPSDSELTTIEEKAFYETKIDGCIKIPPHVKQIGEFAFGETYFTKVEISEDSELQTINKGIFYASPINNITIPSDIELKEGWCFDAYKLNDVKIIVKKKQNIKYYDNLIIGKIDLNSDEFDSLVFVPRDIDTVKIPPFIKRISSYAFSKSQIKEIVIPSNVTVIEKGAFYGCTKLKKIEIAPDSRLRIIDEDVFKNTTINEITIPSSVTKICKTAFSDCRKLISILFTPDSELQEIESYAFEYLPIESFTIPPHVKHINRKTFYACRYLKTVTVAPNSELQTIEKKAFQFSLIENLCVPSSFVEFKDGWCKKADKLKNITIMENKKHNLKVYKNIFIIGKTDVNNDEYDVLVFAARDIKEFTVPSFIKKICSHAFAWSSIENIIITPQVEEIGYEAFCECQNLSYVEIQNGSKLTSIGKYAFSSSIIESILIPQHINEIRKGTFLRCQMLSEIIFTKNSELKIIGKLAFASTSVTNIKLPPSIQDIGESSFSNCQNLVQIEIPSKSVLRTIGNNAFENSSIESIILPPNFAEFKEKWCSDTPKLNEVKITGNQSPYKIEENGLILAKSDLKSSVYDILFFVPRNMKAVILQPFIKKIVPFAFSKSEIESIEIPDHISEIGMGAFLGCKKLNRVSLSENSELREIPIKAFESTSIKEIKLPPHIIKICGNAFYNCSSIELIDIPKNSELREIGSTSFRCVKAKYIYLPKHLTKINDSAFEMCRKFRTIEVAEDSELKIFDYKIFECCEKNIVFKIPPHIKTINYDDFLKCRVVSL